MKKHNNVWFGLLLVCISAIGAYLVLLPQAKTEPVLLNCTSELFNKLDHATEAEHYLIVDLSHNGNKAQVNYRYFNKEGAPAGSILMQGRALASSSSAHFIHIEVTSKQETTTEEPMPAHMQYVSYISSLNLNHQGLHHLNIEVLEANALEDYAVVLFQPSNTVCGCRLLQGQP
ncbi:hypothetical protein [Shewanella sp. NIFS-20-20]|uniref:hypothetical protein n=1 Tax=Shewanella sp. NIFS-20-20 TaxID=2853806 RepID=UPI001C491E3D|nr:hypothetical protein [Shewanella sp. NIFS-20-20]MBV7315917.1 hypothetical protein [Shewanella sp. NIFS-20-20]